MFIKNPIMQIPKELRKDVTTLVIVGGITSIVFDLFAFFLQAGKELVSSGKIVLGLVCIALYYMPGVINASISLWKDEVASNLKEKRNIVVSTRTAEILTKVRGKVYTDFDEVMSANRILLSTSKYIGNVWNFKMSLPDNLIQLISTIVMFIGFVIVSVSEIENIFLFMGVVVVISMLSIYFAYLRGKCRDRFRNNRKEMQEEENAVRNDILNIEPQDKQHADYMINNYMSAMKKSFEFDRKDWRDVNKIHFAETLLRTLATLFVMGIKVYEVGIPNVTIETILVVISLQGIYSQIIGKIYGIIRMFERYREDIKFIKTYEPDLNLILDVLDSKDKNESVFKTTLVVPGFEVEYRNDEKKYCMQNPSEITFETGEVIFLKGPSGSGKTTFLKVLTGKMKLKTVVETFNSIMYQSNMRLGSKDVLSEIIIGRPLDEKKLIYILKGLCLYDEIAKKTPDVLEYLRTTKAWQYSNGQVQRLVLARILYSNVPEVLAIILDEPTNALNDSVAESVLKFIKKCCKSKLLIIASHQVELCEVLADKSFELIETEINRYTLTQKR